MAGSRSTTRQRWPPCTTGGWRRASPDGRHPDDPTGFEIATNCSVVVTDDVDAALDAMRPTLGFYIGGMGARDMNFHKQVFARMGYEAEAEAIQDLFFDGKREEAIAAVPPQMAADISLVGSPEKIRDELAHVGGGWGHDARRRRSRPAGDAPGGGGGARGLTVIGMDGR